MKKLLTIALCLLSILGYTQNWGPVGTGVGDGAGPMAVYNGELYVGGWFTKAGGISVNHIAKWNGSTWSAVGSGVNGFIRTMIVYNGELYVGGGFDTAGGQPVLNIAKWNGISWSAIGGSMGLGPNGGFVSSMAVFNNNLIIAGTFGSINNSAAYGLVSWNGISWTNMGVGIGVSAPESYLLAYDSVLYVGGHFNTYGGIACNSIVQWNGSKWTSLGNGVIYQLSYSGYVNTECRYNNEVFIGGTFDSASGLSDSAAIFWNGANWDPVLATSGFSYQTVYSSIVANNKLYIGGSFYNLNGKYIYNICSWDGSKWDSVGSGLGILGDTGVEHLCIYNNALYATGEFTNPSGFTHYYISKFDNITGITPIQQKQVFSVSPNPSKGIFNFQIANGQKLMANSFIEVYSILGEKVLEQLTVDNEQLTIDLKDQAPGIYFYRLMSKDGEILGEGKLVKQ